MGFALIAAVQPAMAAEVYEIPHTANEIRIDGNLDDAAWDESLVFELNYETNPGENITPPVRTECRMVYSTTHLYYGCHAFDPEPEAIRARYSDRDLSFPNDDVVGLAIDPFNTQNTSFVFDVNPLGVQNDRAYSEIQGRSDPSWDALWDSAGRLVDDGYVVEAKIPFSSLRFPRSTGGPQTWGFNFRRYHPREVYRRISIHPFDRNNACRLCQGSKLVGFEGVDPGRSLEITPTLVGIANSEFEDDGFPDGEKVSESDLDPGISLSWGVTPNLNLSGTINPDFSQVEADVAQLDINRQFALFFPERRPFFLEGNDYFNTRINAVHTRNLADPDWGVKLTGQEGKNGIGVLAVEDAQTNILLPAHDGSDLESLEGDSLAAVVRYRRNVGEASAIGVLATSRQATDYSNTVAGIDGKLRLTTNDTIEFQYLRSQTEYPLEFAREFDQPEEAFSDDAMSFNYNHRRRNWDARAFYRDYGTDFRADLGFIRRVDSKRWGVGGGYKWYGQEDDWYTEIELEGGWDRSERETGELQDEELDYSAGINFRKWQSRLRVGGGVEDTVFEEQLFPSRQFFWFSASTRPSGSLNFGLEGRTGDAIDFSEARPGESRELVSWVGLNPGKHVSATLFNTYQELDINEGNLFKANLTELRLIYQMTSRAFIRLISQVSDVDRNQDLYQDEITPESQSIFSQLLFSYRIDARTALYLGYSAGYLDELDSGLTQTGDTVFLKLSYAWQP
jgi:hypothetical protein